MCGNFIKAIFSEFCLGEDIVTFNTVINNKVKAGDGSSVINYWPRV